MSTPEIRMSPNEAYKTAGVPDYAVTLIENFALAIHSYCRKECPVPRITSHLDQNQIELQFAAWDEARRQAEMWKQACKDYRDTWNEVKVIRTSFTLTTWELLQYRATELSQTWAIIEKLNLSPDQRDLSASRVDCDNLSLIFGKIAKGHITEGDLAISVEELSDWFGGSVQRSYHSTSMTLPRSNDGPVDSVSTSTVDDDPKGSFSTAPTMHNAPGYTKASTPSVLCSPRYSVITARSGTKLYRT